MRGFVPLLRLGIQSVNASSAHYKYGHKSVPGGAKWGIFLFFCLLAVCGGVMYFLNKLLIPLNAFDIEMVAVQILAVLVSSILTFFSARTLVFSIEDMDFVLALPVSPSTIILARVSALYFENLVICQAMLLGAGVTALIAGAPVNLPALLLIGFLLPLMPTTIGLIGGGIITLIASHSKHKNVLTFILGILFFIVMSTSQVFMNAGSFEGLSLESAGNLLDKCFPPFAWGVRAISGELPYLLFCILVHVLPFLLVVWFFGRFYKGIMARMSSSGGTTDYVLKDEKSSGGFAALIGKELRTLGGYTGVALQSASALICVIITACLRIFKVYDTSAIDELVSESAELGVPVLPFLVLIFMVFVLGLSNYGAMSVTLEGKGFWITKLLPVPATRILGAKAGVNVAMSMLIVLLGVPLMSIGMKVSAVDALMMVPMLALYCFAASFMAVFLNLKWPRLDAKQTEIAARGNTSVKVNALVNFGIFLLVTGIYAAFWIVSNSHFSFGLFILVASVVMAVYVLCAWLLLKGKGSRMFQKLY